jgi:glycosyltransferase involved in cell wall biosynthesis
LSGYSKAKATKTRKTTSGVSRDTLQRLFKAVRQPAETDALQVSGWKKRIASALFQKGDLKHASCLQATSYAEIEHIRNFGLINPIALIPNCLNVDFSIPPLRNIENEKKRFGFIGRLNRIKNIDILLKAWRQLNKLARNAELFIIGSGDSVYEKELREYVFSNKIDNVSFEGL